MGIGAVAEPLVVIVLLFGGAWFNRTLGQESVASKLAAYSPLETTRKRSDDLSDSELSDRDLSVDWASSSGTLSPLEQSRWRNRKLRLFRYNRIVSTPNTTVFKDRLLSRLLQKFPFLVEAWYWALIYWVSTCPAHFRACRARAQLPTANPLFPCQPKSVMRQVLDPISLFDGRLFTSSFVQSNLYITWLNLPC